MNTTGSEGCQSRERILKEANRLFTEQGYHRPSMREIAQSAGISKAGLYHHFADKETLFLAVLTQYLNRQEALIEQAEQTDGPVKEKITVMMRLILGQSPAQRGIIRLASQEMGQLSLDARKKFGRIYRQKFINRVTTLLAQGIERGEFVAFDPPFMTWALLGLMYPYFYAAHAEYIPASAEAVDCLLDIFFHGVTPR